MKTKILALSVLILFLVLACQTDSDEAFDSENSLKEIPVKPPTFVDLGLTSQSYSMKTKSGEKMEVILYMAEYITAENSGEMGNTVFFSHRGNKQLGADFVPDVYLNPPFPILNDGTNDITYYVDENRQSNDMDVSVSTAAISRAMTTWDDETCSELGITKVPFDGSRNTGVVAGDIAEYLNDPTLGSPVNSLTEWIADVVHVGWMPAQFWDVLAPGGSNFILGATFTLVVVINDELIDADNNGLADVWSREIYYNDAFHWTDGGTVWPDYDVETVALHEAGHGLSQGHFGKAFRGVKNEKLHFAPRAVMNASYSGVQTEIGKTDNGGHCSNWGSWPNN